VGFTFLPDEAVLIYRKGRPIDPFLRDGKKNKKKCGEQFTYSV